MKSVGFAGARVLPRPRPPHRSVPGSRPSVGRVSWASALPRLPVQTPESAMGPDLEVTGGYVTVRLHRMRAQGCGMGNVLRCTLFGMRFSGFRCRTQTPSQQFVIGRTASAGKIAMLFGQEYNGCKKFLGPKRPRPRLGASLERRASMAIDTKTETGT